MKYSFLLLVIALPISGLSIIIGFNYDMSMPEDPYWNIGKYLGIFGLVFPIACLFGFWQLDKLENKIRLSKTSNLSEEKD